MTIFKMTDKIKNKENKRGGNGVVKVKKTAKEKVKVDKGITLIALVVTIVILIILAGITIASVTGEKE